MSRVEPLWFPPEHQFSSPHQIQLLLKVLRKTYLPEYQTSKTLQDKANPSSGSHSCEFTLTQLYPEIPALPNELVVQYLLLCDSLTWYFQYPSLTAVNLHSHSSNLKLQPFPKSQYCNTCCSVILLHAISNILPSSISKACLDGAWSTLG